MPTKELALKGRLVSFVTDDGVRLNGFVHGGRKGGDCVINVHGMTGNFYGIRQMLLAEMLARKGIAFFSINTRGHDAVSSYRTEGGRVKGKRVKAGTNFERFEECVPDIKAAIGAARRMGFRGITLCGHSTGCQKVIYYQYRSGDKRVKSLILLGPADDYNIAKADLGKDFARIAKLAEGLVARGKGDETHELIPSGFSAQRFDSTVNLDRIEARILNYDGELKEFSRIRIPILAMFGTREEFAVKRVGTCLRILEGRTRSSNYRWHVVKGADHSFKGHERELAGRMVDWVRSL
ncbi:MAG: alpha/beta fold hydrolase [Candidatus Micrarchaeota archaeon]|nr:alpha/beta fold hydrolase [Candidatus Micrarchaeota archaeon]